MVGTSGRTQGGGAVEIGALGQLDLSGAMLNANGPNGSRVFSKGSGGGSGGGIFLHAFDVVMNGSTVLNANGGNGGNHTGQFPGGGGGGGGRIAILTNSSGSFLQGGATLRVNGGTKGTSFLGGNADGSPGSVISASDAVVGLPEPGASVAGLAAIATLAALRRRRPSR